jgi:hypothetical protein
VLLILLHTTMVQIFPPPKNTGGVKQEATQKRMAPLVEQI